jgi:DNA mismatch repair protein MutS
VAEYLHDRIGAKCLFATHYHELCALSEVKPFVRNFNIAVQEWKGKVVFLRKLVPGGSSRSYGIEVARLAGLDGRVVARARKVLAALEGDEVLPGVPVRAQLTEDDAPQLSLFSAARRPPPSPALSPEVEGVLEELRVLDPEQLTPLEALNLLARFRDRLGD